MRHTDITHPENRLSGEINIDSICAFDEKIKDLEKTLTELKRARNSLLNVHKLPPELLGKIFHWNVMLEGDFGGLEEGSHNFLFVCNHWFEVASHTPELWSFWGNTLEDWARWCTRSAVTTPLDLVLSTIGVSDRCINPTLFNMLQDRTSRDTVRRAHFKSTNAQLLRSILSSLTSGSGNIKSDRMESLILWNWDGVPVDMSNFFAHRHLQNLRCLGLANCTISSWDLLQSRTGALTELDIGFIDPTPTPTMLQLLSIIASNPALQEVSLHDRAVPNDHATTSTFFPPLHHLRRLHLSGDLQRVFRLLQHLDYPATLDRLAISLHNCTETDISQIIGPYLRSYLRRRGRSPSGLGLSLFCDNHITFNIGEVGRPHPESVRMGKVVSLFIQLDQSPPKDLLGKAALDLTAYVPQEEILYFEGINEPVGMGDIYIRLPNLRTLCLDRICLPAVFPGPNLSGNESMPHSLQTLALQYTTAEGDDWSPLTTFLSRRASSGNRLNTLKVSYSDHMCLEVVESIKGMVREFSAGNMAPLCSFGTCPEPQPFGP